MVYLTLNEWHKGDIYIWLSFKVIIENSAVERYANVN